MLRAVRRVAGLEPVRRSPRAHHLTASSEISRFVSSEKTLRQQGFSLQLSVPCWRLIPVLAQLAKDDVCAVTWFYLPVRCVPVPTVPMGKWDPYPTTAQ